jgi:hypothetical protein
MILATDGLLDILDLGRAYDPVAHLCAYCTIKGQFIFTNILKTNDIGAIFSS